MESASTGIVLIGAANPETIRMIRAIRRVDPGFAVRGFIDNDPAKHGTDFHGYPVLGGSELIDVLAAEGSRFVNLITGSTVARYEVTLDAVRRGAVLANFIHPGVDLTLTRWGLGNYIQEAVITQAHVEVGDNSSIHMGSLIGHESRIGNSVFIAHAVSISGSCEIGDGTFIGTNATVLPRVRVGKWSIIGAGAVVTRDVPDYSVAVGNPAKVIRSNDIKYDNGRVMA
jgi:sugar O-acyltransferase (sialic acid O-acetyltransferase NeuD family)